MLELTFICVDIQLVCEDLMDYLKSENRYKSLNMLAKLISKASIVLQKWGNKYELL